MQSDANIQPNPNLPGAGSGIEPSQADGDPLDDGKRRYLPVKHTFDFLAAALGLTLLWPVLAAIAAGVKLTSPGPVFYRQIRLGINHRPFLLYKFRSMRIDAEKDGPRWALSSDPRATGFGAFLRRTHLDELPQLINVLRGEMSLVGPRPERPVFVSELQNRLTGYALRMCVRPGITGLAQLNRPPDQTIEDVKIKLDFDLSYLKKCSFKTDLAILAGTACMLAGKKVADAPEMRTKTGEL